MRKLIIFLTCLFVISVNTESVVNEKVSIDQDSEILGIKNQYETHYMKKLKNVLKIYGDKVRVARVEVSADLTDVQTTREEYKPSLTEEETDVTRSRYKETKSFEGEDSITGGESGVESNLFPPEYQYSMGGSGPSIYDKSRESQNYEMDKIITDEKSTPKITVLSAALMVDFSLEAEVDNIKGIVAETFGVSDEAISVSLSDFTVTKGLEFSAVDSNETENPIVELIRNIITIYIMTTLFWLLFGLVVLIISGILIGHDANSRGMNGWGWGIFTFLVLFVAVPVYHVVRKPRLTDELPSNSEGQSNIVTPIVNLSDELQSLVQLKEQGMLTNDEFQLAKKKLIE